MSNYNEVAQESIKVCIEYQAKLEELMKEVPARQINEKMLIKRIGDTVNSGTIIEGNDICFVRVEWWTYDWDGEHYEIYKPTITASIIDEEDDYFGDMYDYQGALIVEDVVEFLKRVK